MTWARGTSGNPSGRVPGTENKSTRLRRLIDARIPEIINTLIESALSGDIQAAKILINRAIPPLRAESMPVNLTPPDGASLAEIGKSIIEAISHGEISADQGAQVLSVLTGQAKLKESEEIEKRLAALEQATNTNSNHK